MTTTSLSFSAACKLLKKNAAEPELIDQLDKLLTFVLIIPAVLVGPTPLIAAEALGLLKLKGEITKLGAAVAKKLISWESDDASTRVERMVAAHAITVYAAFFEALDRGLPALERALGAKVEKTNISNKLRELVGEPKTCEAGHAVAPAQDQAIPVPHPAEGFMPHLTRVRQMYSDFGKVVRMILAATDAWQKLPETSIGKVDVALQDLVNRAGTTYVARYTQLATKYQEFFVWVSLDHQAQVQAKLEMLAGTLTKAVGAENKTIDVGFQTLAEAVAAVPIALEKLKRDAAFSELQNWYDAVLEKPVVPDPPPARVGEPELSFPTVQQIFVPQSFRVARYTGAETLEVDATWKDFPVHDDLGRFLRSYLTSPFSESNPLLILGHPGSGKSLLTQILASRLGSKAYSVLRVELRDVDADVEIPSQVEQQIRNTIGRDVSWATVAEAFESLPGLVILDGYDELLQATGRTHSGYLLKTKLFQETEASVRRHPVRVIVTSRLTLIDKANIPHGTTVVKLEDFDAPKQQKWIEVWNRCNSSYFTGAQIQPFRLPAKNDAVAELARQPLLLLMLAIYDSDGNPLKADRKLDRTRLYDNLIRRFVEREKLKDPQFRDERKGTQDKRVDSEVARLGVPAIGMFNRRALSILESQLNADLSFFDASGGDLAGSGQMLSPGAKLLGSFFFVHESKTATKRAGGSDADIAFEFLHNTFGEFLAADFLLRRIVAECSTLAAMRSQSTLEDERRKKLSSPSGFSQAWFAALSYTPLYSRPVVVEMMRSWLKAKLHAANLRVADFEQELTALVDSHLALVLNGATLPNMMLSRDPAGFKDLPLIGHAAIYTANLVIVAAVLIRDGYTVNGANVVSFIDGARAWDRLSQLWRSWFSIDNLAGLALVLNTHRVEGGGVNVRAQDIFAAGGRLDRVGLLLTVSDALSDQVSAGLLRYLTAVNGASTEMLDRADEELAAEGVNISATILRERIRNATYLRKPRHEVQDSVRRALRRHQFDGADVLVVDALRLARQYGIEAAIDYDYEEWHYRRARHVLGRSGVSALVMLCELREYGMVVEAAASEPALLDDLPPQYWPVIASLAWSARASGLIEAVVTRLRPSPVGELTSALVVAALRLAMITHDDEWFSRLSSELFEDTESGWMLGRVIRILLETNDHDRHLSTYWRRRERFRMARFEENHDVEKREAEANGAIIRRLLYHLSPNQLGPLYAELLRPQLLMSIEGLDSLMPLAEALGDTELVHRYAELLKGTSETRESGQTIMTDHPTVSRKT